MWQPGSLEGQIWCPDRPGCPDSGQVCEVAQRAEKEGWRERSCGLPVPSEEVGFILVAWGDTDTFKA